MYGSVESIQKYFKQSLHIDWTEPSDNNYSVIKASFIRNCLMHNGGIVDKRLADVSNLPIGSKILLNPGDVHGFGIEARFIARKMYSQAMEKHLKAKVDVSRPLTDK